MTKYRSKIGTGILLLGFGVLGVTAAMSVVSHAWAGLFVVIAVALFFSYMLVMTFYTIEKSELVVKCGFLLNLKIDIASIRKIRETNNPLSAPANSLDRLEIFYNTHSSVIISPKNKTEFIQHLLSMNPRIEVQLKK